MQQLFFAVDEGIGIVGRNFKIVAMGNSITRAGFHAIPAENAAVIVDVVNLGVAFRRADTMVAGIFGRLDVDAVRRAGRRAEEAGNALFQTILIAAQHMDATIPILKMRRFGGVILGYRGPDHHLKGRGKSLHQRRG